MMAKVLLLHHFVYRQLQFTGNMLLSNVVINMSEQPKCEIICPVESCGVVSKLSSIQQSNPFVQPKFNIYNFERHFVNQHVRGTKRKPLGDLTNQCQKVVVLSDDSPQQSVPAQSQQQIVEMVNQSTQYQNDMRRSQATIRELENEIVAIKNQHRHSLNNLILQHENITHGLEAKIVAIENQHRQSVENVTVSQNMLLQYQDNIRKLEAEMSAIRINHQQPLTDISSKYQEELLQHQAKIVEVENENRLLKQSKSASVKIDQIHNFIKTKLGDFDDKEVLELIDLILCVDRPIAESNNDELVNELAQCRATIAMLEEQRIGTALHVRKLANDLRFCSEIIILLRHKVMDVRSTVRAFGRIKPSCQSSELFQWNRSNDGTVLHSKTTEIVC